MSYALNTSLLAIPADFAGGMRRCKVSRLGVLMLSGKSHAKRVRLEQRAKALVLGPTLESSLVTPPVYSHVKDIRIHMQQVVMACRSRNWRRQQVSDTCRPANTLRTPSRLLRTHVTFCFLSTHSFPPSAITNTIRSQRWQTFQSITNTASTWWSNSERPTKSLQMPKTTSWACYSTIEAKL